MCVAFNMVFSRRWSDHLVFTVNTSSWPRCLNLPVANWSSSRTSLLTTSVYRLHEVIERQHYWQIHHVMICLATGPSGLQNGWRTRQGVVYFVVFLASALSVWHLHVKTTCGKRLIRKTDGHHRNANAHNNTRTVLAKQCIKRWQFRSWRQLLYIPNKQVAKFSSELFRILYCYRIMYLPMSPELTPNPVGDTNVFCRLYRRTLTRWRRSSASTRACPSTWRQWRVTRRPSASTSLSRPSGTTWPTFTVASARTESQRRPSNVDTRSPSAALPPATRCHHWARKPLCRRPRLAGHCSTPSRANCLLCGTHNRQGTWTTGGSSAMTGTGLWRRLASRGMWVGRRGVSADRERSWHRSVSGTR